VEEMATRGTACLALFRTEFDLRGWTDDAKPARALGVSQATLKERARVFQEMVAPSAIKAIRLGVRRHYSVAKNIANSKINTIATHPFGGVTNDAIGENLPLDSSEFLLPNAVIPKA
jgi:hypothetical protein